MKILIIGVNGKLGHDVMVEALKREYECFVSDNALTYMGALDFGTALDYVPMHGRDKKAVEQVLRDIRPQFVIDCVVWTAVEMACKELNMKYLVIHSMVEVYRFL